MTQTQSITTLATRPSSGRKGWRLEIYEPLGQELLVTYDSATNPGPIHEGFNSRRYPNNTCGPGSFLAIPKYMIGGDPRNIVKIAYDTGTKVVPVYFGYIAKAPDPRKGEVSKYELSSGKELLKNSLVADTFAVNFEAEVDGGYWIRQLVGTYRHKALKFDASFIPLTGVMFAGTMYDAAGATVYEAIEAIIKGCPAIGENDWGVNPDGYVVIQPSSGSYTFQGDDNALKYGDRDAELVCTAAKINLIRDVSNGAVVSAGYRPRLISYTHTDPAHIIYEASRSFKMPEKKDGTPILEVLQYIPDTGGSYHASYIPSDPTKTGFQVLQDGDLSTYVYNSTAETRALGVNSYDDVFVGVAVVIDAVAGTYNLVLKIAFSFFNQATSVTTDTATVTFDLNGLKGQGKVEARFIAPIPSKSNRAFCDLTIGNPAPAANSVKVYELRGLRMNGPLLEQIAQSNIRLPARQVSQITFANTVTDSGVLGGYLLEEPVKTLYVKGENGQLIPCEPVEYNDTCTGTEGQLTRADIGEIVRSPDFHTINDAINRALEAYS